MTDKKKCSAIIVAAGSGTRMGGPVPKQFIELCGKPILAYTLETFEKSSVIDEVVIVTGSEWKDFCRDEIVTKYRCGKVSSIVAGGSTRCFSVLNGLKACRQDTDFVFIHDGVRAMISEDIIQRGYVEARKHESAVASIASTDTVRITDQAGNVILTPDRNSVRCMQTPQIFDFKKLYAAYLQMTDEEMRTFTDDAFVWERYRPEKLHLYEGSRDNIKITTPDDLVFAEKTLGHI